VTPAATSLSLAPRKDNRTASRRSTGTLVPESDTVTGVEVDVIVLNGGSSSGKSSLAVCLQQRLPGTWLTLGIDDLIRALSHGPTDTTAAGTLEFKPDGSIAVGLAFRQAEASWYEGLAAIARAGTGVIVDEVFLDGGVSQAGLQAALRGLAVVWVGVRCHPDTAEARELRRPDRIKGMAKDQAERVHKGVSYDIVVGTTDTSQADCARLIVATLEG
jgi:chloramphenicol 3-O phosphotransferase